MTTLAAPLPPIAIRSFVAPGLVCFSTSRAFDTPVLPLRQGGMQRLRTLLEAEGLQPGAILYGEQVHGAVVAVDSADTGAAADHVVPGADGLATARRGVFLVIRTADCVPVVLADAGAGVVAAVHAGWRGTLAGIVQEGVRALLRLGARPEAIRAWTGPAIQKPSYEVSPELAEQFADRWGHLQGAWRAGRHLDLPALNRLQAVEAGLEAKNLFDAAACTHQDPGSFYSHRRDGTARGQIYTVCGFPSE